MPRLWFHHLHSGRHGLRGEGRLATLDRVEHAHAVRAKRGICRLADRRDLPSSRGWQAGRSAWAAWE